MFKKIAVVCAALAVASAQNVQDLANQAVAAAAPVLNQQAPVTESANGLSLNVNDYEWSLTEVNGEYNLAVAELGESANNLVPTLAALLANVGSVAQDNSGAIENIINAEAAANGVQIENVGDISEAASQLGAQLSENAGAVANAAEQQYNTAAVALAENQNGVTTQVNNAVQNQEALSAAVSNGVNAAVQNSGAVQNLPVQVNGNVNSLTEAALSAAGNVNTNDAAAAANNLANQAINAGVEAVNNNVGGNLANAAQNAAGTASQSAATSLSAASSSLNANNVNDANSAAALVGNQ